MRRISHHNSPINRHLAVLDSGTPPVDTSITPWSVDSSRTDSGKRPTSPHDDPVTQQTSETLGRRQGELERQMQQLQSEIRGLYTEHGGTLGVAAHRDVGIHVLRGSNWVREGDEPPPTYSTGHGSI